jgi:hypothetical protein
METHTLYPGRFANWVMPRYMPNDEEYVVFHDIIIFGVVASMYFKKVLPRRAELKGNGTIYTLQFETNEEYFQFDFTTRQAAEEALQSLQK